MRILLLCLYTISCFQLQAQKDLLADINLEAVGVIYFNLDDGKTKKATGFVAGKSDLVLTCAHFTTNCPDTLYFIQNRTGKVFNLTLVYSDTLNDIAVLSSDASITNLPYSLNKRVKVTPGDSIWYIGYLDSISTKSNVVFSSCYSIVKTEGVTWRNGVVGTFEFEGCGVPGFSGAPIFGMNGKVIGIWQGAWQCTIFKSGRHFIMNRAFYIKHAYKSAHL